MGGRVVLYEKTLDRKRWNWLNAVMHSLQKIYFKNYNNDVSVPRNGTLSLYFCSWK